MRSLDVALTAAGCLLAFASVAQAGTLSRVGADLLSGVHGASRP